jgi:hypothetical protein
MLMEKRSQEKQIRWELLREDEKVKATINERRARAKEKCAMAELIAEENKTMMMDPSLRDEFTKEWWILARMEILQRRREAAAWLMVVLRRRVPAMVMEPAVVMLDLCMVMVPFCVAS